MAESGILVRDSAVALVNGTYRLHVDSPTKPEWLSADQLSAIWYDEKQAYEVIPTDINSIYTPEVKALQKKYCIKSSDGTYLPFTPTLNEYFWKQLGNVQRIPTSTLTARPMTWAEAKQLESSTLYFYDPTEVPAKRFNRWNYSPDRRYDDTDGVDHSSEPADDHPLWYYLNEDKSTSDATAKQLWIFTENLTTLYAETNMNHWVISKATVTASGIVKGQELYYAFAERPTILPYNGLTWIYMASAKGVVDTHIKLDYWDQSSINVTTVKTTDEDGAERVTTTYTNLVTGEVHKDVNVVRTKTKYQPQLVTRYDYINLTVGQIYRFRFVPEFAKLGWIPGDDSQPLNAGIYKVDNVMTYYDAVKNRIDLYVNLYEKCNVPKEVHDTDKARLADTILYRLVDPVDPSIVIYMPQIFIEGQPDVSVLEYDKVMLMIDLGIQANADEVDKLRKSGMTGHDAVLSAADLEDLTSMISAVLEKKYGIKRSATTPVIRQRVYGHIWLTDRGFRTVREQRDAIRKFSRIDLNQLLGLQASNRWYLENQRLNNLVQHQDELIQQLHARL